MPFTCSYLMDYKEGMRHVFNFQTDEGHMSMRFEFYPSLYDSSSNNTWLSPICLTPNTDSIDNPNDANFMISKKYMTGIRHDLASLGSSGVSRGDLMGYVNIRRLRHVIIELRSSHKIINMCDYRRYYSGIGKLIAIWGGSQRRLSSVCNKRVALLHTSIPDPIHDEED